MSGSCSQITPPTLELVAYAIASQAETYLACCRVLDFQFSLVAVEPFAIVLLTTSPAWALRTMVNRCTSKLSIVHVFVFEHAQYFVEKESVKV